MKSELHEYEELTQHILRRHLREYDTFVNQRGRALNRSKWKPIKSVGNLTVFLKQVRPELKLGDAPSDVSTSNTSADSWSSGVDEDGEILDSAGYAKLAMVGTMTGTLEDALYGVLARDMGTIKIHRAYFQDVFVDWRVFPEIKGPTRRLPFQYLGVKSMVMPLMKPLVSRRLPACEFVLVEAVGIHVTTSDERVGYFIMHSIDPPDGIDPAPKRGSVRTKSSVCVLFKQLANNTLDMYARSVFETTGRATERIVISKVAHTLLSVKKWVSCAENKKLAWLVRASIDMGELVNGYSRRFAVKNGADTASFSMDNTSCSMCGKRARVFRSLARCVICTSLLCGKCRIARQLHFIKRDTQLITVPTCFCVGCIARAAGICTTEIMRHEYVRELPEPQGERPVQTGPSLPATPINDLVNEYSHRERELCRRTHSGGVEAKAMMQRTPSDATERLVVEVGDTLVEIEKQKQQRQQ